MTAPPTTDTDWRGLGDVAPKSLVDARLQAHHAVQIIVSAAISYLPHRPDDSHTNLEWLPTERALTTNVIEPKRVWRLGLRIDGLELVAFEAGQERSAFPLHGQRLPDALVWLTNTLTAAELDATRLTTDKHYTIPGHPVAESAPWDASDVHALRELSNAYHDAWVIATAVQARTPGASEPRCWPHHFDLATLITLQKASDGRTRTIGVGLSPGDDSYAEPYFYVTPFPYPGADSVAPLDAGGWHTQGWFGAVLTVSELIAGPEDRQRDRAQVFVDQAVVECRKALSGT